MKNFRKFSEEKPPSEVSTKVANLDVCRSNRTALLINEGDGVGSKSRGPPGSRMPQNSSVFCSQKRMNSMKYSDSLQLNCTEGLGFESSDEREDSVSLGSDHSTASSPRPGNNNNNDNNYSNNNNGEGEADGDRTRGDSQSILDLEDRAIEEERRSRVFQRWNANAAAAAGPAKRPGRPPGGFPPPLPSIARNGQPWIILRSFRTDGRFVLQEVKAPPHEILHAWRQDGRLKLQLVHREDEGLCPAPDDADDDGSANPVENERSVAEAADVEIHGAESPSEILH